jgi:hypothetical protein
LFKSDAAVVIESTARIMPASTSVRKWLPWSGVAASIKTFRIRPG